jgi:hypothetical protein
MTVPVFPDVESALLYALVPEFPDIRFVTYMPGGELTMTTARLHRISGANRDIGVDRPVVDIDVFGLRTGIGQVSAAAREIQAFVLSLMSVQVSNGVIVHVTTVNGPRSLPEANQELCRYSATYEIMIHP